MNLAILIDGPSALIVLGGTLLATWLRAGNRDCARTLARLTQLGRARFDAEGTRAELSRQVQEIRREVNTLTVKGADPEVDERALQIKSELERLREQAANLE